MTSPFPDLPLPVRVLDLEISRGVKPITGCAGYNGLCILVRWNGRPLGQLTMRCSGDVVEADDISAMMRQKLVGRTAHQLLLDLVGVGKDILEPPITVVICTRDRPDQLARCLRSISALDYPEFEVIVVDNASQASTTREIVEQSGFRYVREDRPGLDWARNRGLAEATHHIVAYTDDDVEVDRGWLRGIATGFADPGVSAVTGLIRPAAMDTQAEILFELCYGGMGKGTAPRRWDPRLMHPMEKVATHHVGVGANMAYRRELLLDLGGFDTALDVGTPSRGAGDLDMLHRVLASGAVIRYEPTALIRHHHRREMAALERQHNDNGRAFGVYLLKVFRRGTVSRLATFWYGTRIWFLWLISRGIRRFRKLELLPGNLLLAEFRGALAAPRAYIATRLHDRALRRRFQPGAGQSAGGSIQSRIPHP